MKRLIAIDSESALNDCIEGINIKSLICAEIGNGNLTSDLSENEIMDILKKRAEKIYFNPKINELSTDEKEKERLHILAEKQLEKYLKENDYMQEFKKDMEYWNSKNKDCYEQLKDKHDKVGDIVETNKSYEDTDNRFVYYCGQVLVKHCSDHLKLLNELKDKMSNEKMEKDNYDFVTGKIENGVAIMETSELNENSIESIAKDIMKQTHCDKVYSNENDGNDKTFQRIAKKRLIK